MTSSQAAVRIGRQTPRLEALPLFHTSAGDDAVDLAAVAGLTMDDWQEHVLRGSLGERKDGRWSAFEVGLVVPRQNGKNAVLEARELAGLFLFGESLIIHTAHQFKTAREAFDKILRRIRTSPELVDQVLGYEGDPYAQMDGIKTGSGNEGIELKNGNRLRVFARSLGGGRGFSGDLVIFDEAYSLGVDEIAAMLPTMAAKSMDGNPQLWYTSSAGMPASTVLADLRARGTSEDSGRLAYFEWSCEPDADPEDPASWYEANPGLGVRIAEEFVLNEYEALKESGLEQFKRERLGIWSEIGAETLIPAHVWGACVDESSRPGDLLVFGVDVPPSRDTAVISLASVRSDGMTHIEVIDQRAGTSWVAPRLRELVDKWSPAGVFMDEGGAVGTLIPDLRRERVKHNAVSRAEYARACGLMLDGIRQGSVRHVDDPVLNGAVDSAKTKGYGDTLWIWDRKNAAADVSPMVAATLALHGVQSKARKQARSNRGRVVVLS